MEFLRSRWQWLAFGLAQLLFALGLCGGPCAAQLAPLRLSLAEALARVEEHAPELVMAEHAVRKAEAQRNGAGVIMPQNPRVSADVRSPGDSGWARDAGYGAMLDLLFEVGGAPAARVREVDKNVRVARAERDLGRLQARLGVWATYLQAQIARMRIEHARSAAELGGRVLSAAKKRVELGAASDLELTSAELALAQIEVAGRAAEREHDALTMALRDALDLRARQPLELTTEVEDPPPLAPLDGYVDRARRVHPLTAASDARMRALEATRERLEREKFPRVGVYGGVDAAPSSHSFAVLGLSVELPFAQRNQGPLAVNARAQEAERSWRVLREHRIEREVVAAWQAYESRRAELEGLSNGALPAAQRSFQLAEAGFSAGRFDWFRVAVAARDLVRVRAERLDALAAAWAQRIAVEEAAGGNAP